MRASGGRWWAWAWAWAWTWLAAPAAARELDPAACAARFDVQRDKIIRTEESREMGARYLAELDVGARAECVRLCCETDACDVFVFEEKNPGSCYLFACGPPEDFRCKFTAHGNFSSGVLALSRRLAELQDQQRLAHRERQLAGLRTPASTTARAAPATRSTAPPPEPPAPPREPPPPALPKAGRCSRYQFECRRGGECIAVYNACDGVPQCADGSDEAPELGCPPAPAPEPAPAPAPPALPPSRPPPPQIQDSGEDVNGIAVAGNNDALVEGADLWPHRLTQAQPPRRFTAAGAGAGAAGGSHIFSHKGGLLQAGALDAAPRAAWPQRAWQPPPDAAEGLEAERGWGAFGRLDWPEPEPRRAWPVPPPRPDPEIPIYMPSKTMPEMPIMYSSQQQTLRDSPKKGFELMSQGAPPAPAAAAPAPPAPAARADAGAREQKTPLVIENTTKKKVLKDIAEAPGAAALAARAHWPPDEHDGLSEHPPAAVLLLVLGSLMTASLGALLACRARAARRRRRAHPRLALDADYLVNGMYL